jgi:hypothetical protein
LVKSETQTNEHPSLKRRVGFAAETQLLWGTFAAIWISVGWVLLAVKLEDDRPYADPEAAARKLVEIANSVEAVQDGRIYIELINYPMRTSSRPRRRNTGQACSW